MRVFPELATQMATVCFPKLIRWRRPDTKGETDVVNLYMLEVGVRVLGRSDAVLSFY